MAKKDLDNYFKETYPFLLERYNFLWDRRIKDIDEKLNFLVLLISILFLVYFEILKIDNNNLFYIPLFLLFLSLSPIFFNIIPRKVWFHWFEMEDYRTFYLEKENFFEMGFKDIFETIQHINAYSIFKKRLYFISMGFFFLSLSSILIIITHTLFKNNLMSLFTFLLTMEFLFFILYYLDRELISNPSKEARDFLNKWINNKKNKNGLNK